MIPVFFSNPARDFSNKFVEYNQKRPDRARGAVCVCVCFLSVPAPLCSEQQSIHDEGSQSRGRGSGQLSKYQRRNLQQDFLLVRRAAPFRRPRNATTKNWTERWTWISWRLRARERERAEKGRRALKASRRWNLIDQDRKSQEQPGSSFVCSSFFFFFYLLFSYWKLLPSWFSTNIFPPPFSSITTGTMLPWLRVGGNNKITPRGVTADVFSLLSSFMKCQKKPPIKSISVSVSRTELFKLFPRAVVCRQNGSVRN